MSKRTTMVLGAVALGLLAFIVFYERHTLSSGETAERQDRLLRDFVRDKVSEIEIDRGEEKLVLVREVGTDEDMLEPWKLTAPVKAEADDDAVESLLGSLEWAVARRDLEGVEAADRKRFGLDHPKVRAWFTVVGERRPIAIGKKTPTGDGYYVQLDNPTKAYVVGKDLFEALDHEPGHFRSKALFPEHDPGDAEGLSVAVSGEGAERTLVRRAGRWWLTAPFEAYASSARVDAALDAVLGAKATRFVADEPKDLGKYGLASPSLRATARGHEPAPADSDGAGDESAEKGKHHEPSQKPFEVVLAVGDKCGAHEGERYARAAKGPVVCLKDEALAPLRRDAEELRQTRLTAVDGDALAGAEVVRGGSKLELSSKDGKWTWKAAGRKAEAERDAVGDWIGRLHKTTAKRFEAIDAERARAFGLDQPTATLTLRTDAGAQHVLYLGGTSDEGAWVRRDSEPFALLVPEETARAFEASPVRFRDRTLITEQDDAAEAASVQRGSVAEKLERGDDGWRVVEPVSVAADKVLVRQLVRAMGNLRAERFETAGPEPGQGLEAPRWVVTVRFEGPRMGHQKEDAKKAPAPREHRLRIGADAPGGAYAQLDGDPAVFVVPQDLVDAVEQPLVSRDLLATDADAVSELRLTHGAVDIELTCDDGQCKDKSGGPADADLTRKLLDRLGALRATATTAYGPPSADSGLRKPRARVTVTRTADADEPKQYTFLIGATEGVGDAAQTAVRREGLDVGFVFPAYVMDSFVDYKP